MSDDRDDGLLSPDGVRRLYDRIAPLYDLATVPYRALGGYRLVDRAIEALRLAPGDIVVELGTGSGYALPGLSAAVGPTGRVVAVDISPRILARARARSQRQGLGNVELVQADIADFRLAEGTTAVLSAFAMEMVPQYDAVIARLLHELPAGGRLAVTGLRDPQDWPEWLIRLGSWLNRPFGVSEAYRHHRPWQAVEAHTADATYTDIFGGAVYLATGTAPGPHHDG